MQLLTVWLCQIWLIMFCFFMGTGVAESIKGKKEQQEEQKYK